MRLIYTFLSGLGLMLLAFNAFPQANTDANVFGHVVSVEDNEHIPFINVLVEGTRLGTITDATGHYMLTNLPVGKHTLVVKGMGLKPNLSNLKYLQASLSK
jgi:iron complex outermembrane recepter protein